VEGADVLKLDGLFNHLLVVFRDDCISDAHFKDYVKEESALIAIGDVADFVDGECWGGYRTSSQSVPIQRPFLRSTAPINAFVNQIDILSSKRGCLCQRLHP
jgi:hypothetical protein